MPAKTLNGDDDVERPSGRKKSKRTTTTAPVRKVTLHTDTGSRRNLKQKMSIRDLLARHHFTRIVETLQLSTRETEPKPSSRQIVVGIIGAGCAGLYSAMILRSLGIEFVILEGSDRVGGRVKTHEFSDQPYDYFDVGAMRFPRLWFMRRLTVDLVKKLKLESKMIPYYMTPHGKHPNTRSYYNGISHLGDPDKATEDVFKITISNGGTIPKKFFETKMSVLNDRAFDPFMSLFRDVQDKKNDDDQKRKEALIKAVEMLEETDMLSTRSYLSKLGNAVEMGADTTSTKTLLSQSFDKDLGLPASVIQWMETINTGAAGWYDEGLTQTVLEMADFDSISVKHPSWVPPGSPLLNKEWCCFDGGSETITTAMRESLGLSVEDITCRKVTAIKLDHEEHPEESKKLLVTVEGYEDVKPFDHVICTTTLGALATIETGNCFTYNQKVAIRSLQYDASCKIGVKFKSRWWQDATIMKGQTIYGGVSHSDLSLSNVVYPSYPPYPRNAKHPPEAPGVLICSYTWAQDAKRLGSLIGHGGAVNEELKQLVISDLSKIHSASELLLKEQWEDSYAYAWYNDPFYRGAFAIFGPSQFFDTYYDDDTATKSISMFDSLKMPAANNRLHLAGEATSVHHGWIIGALNSAWRAVRNIILELDDCDVKMKELVEEWEIPDEEVDVKDWVKVNSPSFL